MEESRLFNVVEKIRNWNLKTNTGNQE